MTLEMFQKKTNPPPFKIKEIIAVASGKGGVGKSTVTVNLALALKKLNYSVGILDADIYGPSIQMMLEEDLIPKQEGDLIYPAASQGIKIMSMAYFKPQNEATLLRAPIVNRIIKQFLKNVVWGDLDFLLIDFPPGTGDIQITLAQEARLTAALIVTTPQNVALLDVRKSMDMFLKMQVPLLGIIENMSYFLHEKTKEKFYIFGEGGGENLALEYEVPFLQSIPLHPKICEYGDLGKSLFQEKEAEKVPYTLFKELSEQFIFRLNELKNKSGGSFGGSSDGFKLKMKEL